MPESRNAWRAACTPMSNADTPSKRPNGCRPTPTIAMSAVIAHLRHGTERVRDDVVAVGVLEERHHDDLHLHADGARRQVVGVDATLDPRLPGELHIADGERFERL